LRAKMESSWIRHPSASAARIANSTARRLSTGSAPGNPKHTGHSCVFGSAPNRVLQPQKIFVAVRSCAWISRPMTGSNVGTDDGLCHESANLRLDNPFEGVDDEWVELHACAADQLEHGFGGSDG